MRKLTIIIMFLLLCPSLVLAEEESVIIEKSVSKEDRKNIENFMAARDIARDIFAYEFYKTYGEALRLRAIFLATGYKNLAEEIEKDALFSDVYASDWFYKYNKKYKYNASDNYMFTSVITRLEGLVFGYKVGAQDTLSNAFILEKDMADTLKRLVPQMYENYLERKKKVKEEEK